MAKGIKTNYKEFNLALDEAANQIEAKDLVLLTRWVGLEALRKIVLRTPVDTGRARGNWQMSQASPIERELDRTDLSQDGIDTVTKGQQDLGELKPFTPIFIVNNVPYINELENGHSSQAPAGTMVALTMAELESVVKEQLE